MKQKLLVVLTLIMVNVAIAQEPVEYVNPFIGTANYGATYPGPVAPSGMVSVVPYNVGFHDDNTLNTDVGWLSNPYVNHNKFLSGFTHVNLSGVGCPDFGSIILMPSTGDLEVDHKKYGTHYSDENASAGFYSTYLDRYKIKCEMTATTRSGLSRYTFPQGESNILLNLGLGLTNETGAMARIVSDTEIEGFKIMGTFCYNPQAVFPVYFVVKFNKPAKEMGYWKRHKKLEGPRHNWCSTSGKYKMYQKYMKEMVGDDIGVYFRYDTNRDETIEVQVGVSYVSIANARENLEAEQSGFDFEKVRNQTRQDWNQLLSRIKVEGGTYDDKVKFYTALYHILIHPNILQDVNGQYPAMESSEILSVDKGNRYTVFSLWDTYRNVHPFLSLVYPRRQLDMVGSMISMYKESGWLPKWELYSRETNVMEGDPSIPVIVDTYRRGIDDFDVETAYEAMVKSATTQGSENALRPDIDHYLKKGYVPLEKPFDNSVSHALEYYIADWNLAQLSKELGYKDDYKRFLKQSLGYRNYFDKEFMMLRPRKADGEFLTPFDPKQGENFTPSPGFHEGTAWQYTFYVPHDIKGLMKLMGGSAQFAAKLQKVFDDNLFDMANEPDITYPYLFNYVKGEQWRTQKQVRNLIDSHFTNKPGGLPGNDDTGTLSAWLVYSMMGFYPVCPGDMHYALSSPVFKKITIELDTQFYSRKHIVIEAPQASEKNIFIERILVDGQKWKDNFITHQELVKGGILRFKLVDKP